MPLIDYLDGISFMPLYAKLFLETQCFIEQVGEECTEVQQVMFLYQTRLGHHSIDKVALRTLFGFVTKHMIPYALDAELQPDSISM